MNADVIVLGLGAMGSAAAWRLAKRGVKVIGIEQFEFNHALGSSHGESRIIRQAYFEHSDYVPLLLRTYDLWRELEADVNVTLLHEVGLILAGPADGEAISGALGSARQHGLRIEAMTPAETLGRWPTLRINEDLPCFLSRQRDTCRLSGALGRCSIGRRFAARRCGRGRA